MKKKCKIQNSSFRFLFEVIFLSASNIWQAQEGNDQRGNEHYSRELLTMGIVVPETCLAYKKHNKITSGI